MGGKAERLVETVKLRNALIREAAKLLPEAIRQAKPKGGRKRKDATRTHHTNRNASARKMEIRN